MFTRDKYAGTAMTLCCVSVRFNFVHTHVCVQIC